MIIDNYTLFLFLNRLACYESSIINLIVLQIQINNFIDSDFYNVILKNLNESAYLYFIMKKLQNNLKIKPIKLSYLIINKIRETNKIKSNPFNSIIYNINYYNVKKLVTYLHIMKFSKSESIQKYYQTWTYFIINTLSSKFVFILNTDIKYCYFCEYIQSDSLLLVNPSTVMYIAEIHQYLKYYFNKPKITYKHFRNFHSCENDLIQKIISDTKEFIM